MGSQGPNEPVPPPVVQVSPTELAGDWPAELRRKLAEQGLDPGAVERVTGEVARLAPALFGDPARLRAAARTHLVLGAVVLIAAAGSALVNSLLHGHAVGYGVAAAGALWGLFLLWRGLAQRRRSRQRQEQAARVDSAAGERGPGVVP
jgi:hypothetical protein